MADVKDVAAAVIAEIGSVSTMKLQKLLYYCQGCHLALHGTPMFEDPIEAWTDGPVVRSVFRLHKGRSHLTPSTWAEAAGPGANALPSTKMSVVLTVAEALGGFTGDALVGMTHAERPWLDARRGLSPDEHSQEVVSHKDISEFFSVLTPGREPSVKTHGEAIVSLYCVLANQRAMTPPAISTQAQLEEWNRMLDEPPRPDRFRDLRARPSLIA